MPKEKSVMGSGKNIRYKADEKDAGLLYTTGGADDDAPTTNLSKLRKSSASPYYETADVEANDEGTKVDQRNENAQSTAGRKGTQSGRRAVKGESQFDQYKKGGKVKKYAKGGSVSRGDGICKKGHTKGKMV